MQSLLASALALLTSAMCCAASAEDGWVTVSRDGKREVQVDRAGIVQSDAGTRVAWARMVLSPVEADAAGYTTVLALNRYDCLNRGFATIRRRYLDDRNVVLREEEVLDQSSRPVARGGVDDRLWREICRPPSTGDLVRLAEEAERVAAALAPKPAATAPESAPAALPEGPARLPSARQPTTVVPPAPAATTPRRAAAPAATQAASPNPLAPRHPSVSWTYEGITGPELWGRLRPDWAVCSTGRRQSPIDLRSGVAVDLEPVVFDYRPSYFRVIDTGQLLRIQVGEGLGVRIRGERYELVFIELHRPGEPHIEGRAFDASVELHHRAPDGRIAVVSVLLEAGSDPHPVLQTWLGSLPLERGGQYEPRFAMDLAPLVPGRPDHFLYSGSLTMPPCTEGVTRVVMKEPLRMSWEQLGVLARLHPPNARPLQIPYERLVLESR